MHFLQYANFKTFINVMMNTDFFLNMYQHFDIKTFISNHHTEGKGDGELLLL